MGLFKCFPNWCQLLTLRWWNDQHQCNTAQHYGNFKTGIIWQATTLPTHHLLADTCGTSNMDACSTNVFAITARTKCTKQPGQTTVANAGLAIGHLILHIWVFGLPRPLAPGQSTVANAWPSFAWSCTSKSLAYLTLWHSDSASNQKHSEHDDKS